MPVKPPKACEVPGCGRVDCEVHRRKRGADRRKSAARRGYGRRWRTKREAFLSLNPLCQDCLNGGRVTAATNVHHIFLKRDGGADSDDNLMALCHACHSKRTGAGE